MLCITLAGTIHSSPRFITATCGIVEKLQFGNNLMADKRFNISDLPVSKGWRLIIPPFLRDKNRVSKKNCKTISNVAKACIHDQLDDFFTICCALINLGPALVPL